MSEKDETLDEGERAIEAAAAKVRLILNGETPTNATCAREVIRAYLAALPGWRLVRVEDLHGTCCSNGLEYLGDGNTRECSICGGDGISPAYKLAPPGLTCHDDLSAEA